MKYKIFIEFMKNIHNRAEKVLNALVFLAAIYSFFMVNFLLKLELRLLGVQHGNFAVTIVEFLELIFMAVLLLYSISALALFAVKVFRKEG